MSVGLLDGLQLLRHPEQKVRQCFRPFVGFIGVSLSIEAVVPDTQEKVYAGAERKAYFWDSSSPDEEVNPTRETLENIKLNSSKEGREVHLLKSQDFSRSLSVKKGLFVNV